MGIKSVFSASSALLGLVLSFVCGSSANASTEPDPAGIRPFKLLLTSFDPFGSSTTNNSQAIVRALTHLGETSPLLGPQVEIVECNLPVVYDQASSVAMACVDHDQPDAVVSLGEAACDLRIETAATNWDATSMPDNAGQVRTGSTILPNGPRRSSLSFPGQAMYCGLSAAHAPKIKNPAVIASADPGAFVCNNTAYLLSQELAKRGTPYTFIHVPNSQCLPKFKNAYANAQLIAEMLGPALATLRASTKSVEMPANREQAQELLNELKNAKRPACEVSFAQSLLSAERF